MRGVLVQFNYEKGCGFISCQGSGLFQDLFVHASELGECEVGHAVEFNSFTDRSGKPEAKKLKRLNASESAVVLDEELGTKSEEADPGQAPANAARSWVTASAPSMVLQAPQKKEGLEVETTLHS